MDRLGSGHIDPRLFQEFDRVITRARSEHGKEAIPCWSTLVNDLLGQRSGSDEGSGRTDKRRSYRLAGSAVFDSIQFD